MQPDSKKSKFSRSADYHRRANSLGYFLTDILALRPREQRQLFNAADVLLFAHTNPAQIADLNDAEQAFVVAYHRLPQLTS